MFEISSFLIAVFVLQHPAPARTRTLGRLRARLATGTRFLLASSIRFARSSPLIVVPSLATTIVSNFQVAVREVVESDESFVIQGWRPDSRRSRRCGCPKTAQNTIVTNCAIRAI